MDAFISEPGGSGTGGTGPHNLLSSVEHPDTTTGTPVRGDLIVADVTPSWTKLPLGATDTLLGSNGSDPVYRTLTAILDAVLGSARGMVIRRGTTVWEALAKGTTDTILSADANDTLFRPLTSLLDTLGSAAHGSILFRGAASWELLAPGTDTKVLTTHGAGFAPTYEALSAAAFGTQTDNVVLAGPNGGGPLSPTFRALVNNDLPTVATTKGGTGLTSYTAGDIIYASATNTLTQLAKGTARQLLSMNSGATAPEWNSLTALLDAVFGSTRGQVLRRGTSVWEALNKGSTNTILSADANDTLFQTLSALIDGAIGSTRGSILYRGSGGWAIRTPGTDGQVLATGGAGADPDWVDPQTGVDGLLRAVLLHDVVSPANPYTYTVEAGTIANTNGSGLRFMVRIYSPTPQTITVKLDATTMISIAVGNSGGAHISVLSGTIMRSASNELEVTATLIGLDDSGSNGLLSMADFANGFAVSLSSVDFDLTFESTGSGAAIQSVLLEYVNGVATTPPDPAETTGVFTPGTAGIPTLMVERVRSGNTGLYRWDGSSLTTVEADYAGVAAETGTVDASRIRANTWVEFRGKEYIVHTISTTSHKVYERPLGGTTNGTAVHTATVTTSAALKTGLHVVNNGTDEVLVFCYMGSAANALPAMSVYDGTTWTAYTGLGTNLGTATAMCAHGVAVKGSTLYVPVASSVATAAFYAFDAIGHTATAITAPVAQGGVCAVIHNRVFYMSLSNTTADVMHTLYEVTGTITSSLVLTDGGGDGATANGAGGFMCPYGDDLLIVYCANAGATAGNIFFRASLAVFSTPGATPTETTKTGFLPTALETAGGAVGTLLSYFMDTQTDPGAPAIFVFKHVTAGTTAIAQVVDADTELSFSDTGLSPQNYSWPQGRTTDGGARTSPDDTDNLIFKRITVTRGTDKATITFTLDAQTGGDTWTIKLWASQEHNGTYAQATLISGSGTGGGTVVGNELQGVPDNTSCSFAWDLDADAIPDNTPFDLMLKAYRE